MRVKAGKLNLNDLNDVSASSPNENDFLTYNSASGKWVSEALSGGVSLWKRVGTALFPNTDGDDVITTGSISGNSIYSVGNVSGNDFYVSDMSLSGSTYKTINDFFRLFVSAGRVSGGEITDAGSQTVDVAGGTGVVRVADSEVSQAKFFDWSESNGISIPTNSTRYIGVEYNAGSPQVVVKTTNTWDFSTEFPLGSVINQVGDLYILNNYWKASDVVSHITERFQAEGYTRRDEHVGGLTLGTSAGNSTRKPTLSAGVIWSRLTKFSISAKDCSAADTFYGFYRDGAGGWTRTAQKTDIDDYYDDGSGTLKPLNNNKYANFWVFVEIDTANDGQLMVIYPQNQYNTPAEADVGDMPAFPTSWYEHGVFVGRIIVKQGTTAPVAVESAFYTPFNYSLIGDHGNQSGLEDDDHPQYLLADGTRAMNGNLDLGGNDIDDGGDVTATSFTIGANTLTTSEFSNLDGLDQSVSTTDGVTFNDVTISTPSNIYSLSHDSFADYVANEHVDHSGVSITAGTGLTGGGDITSSRTLSLSHLGIESLSDPDADALMGWDDTDGAVKFIGVGSGLSYDHATHTLSSSITQYTDEKAQDAIGSILDDGTVGEVVFTYDDDTPKIYATVQDSEIDHNSLANTHNLTTDIDHDQLTNTHNLTTDIDHNQLTNYVADEHIDWTSASDNFSTEGNVNVGGDFTHNKMRTENYSIFADDGTDATLFAIDGSSATTYHSMRINGTIGASRWTSGDDSQALIRFFIQVGNDDDEIDWGYEFIGNRTSGGYPKLELVKTDTQKYALNVYSAGWWVKHFVTLRYNADTGIVVDTSVASKTATPGTSIPTTLGKYFDNDVKVGGDIALTGSFANDGNIDSAGSGTVFNSGLNMVTDDDKVVTIRGLSNGTTGTSEPAILHLDYTHRSTSSTDQSIGFIIEPDNERSGDQSIRAISQLIKANPNNNPNTYQQSIGLWIQESDIATADIGLVVGDTASTTKDYAIYSSNTSDSYFAGNIGVGVTTPNRTVHIQSAEDNSATDIASVTAGLKVSNQYGASGGKTGVYLFPNLVSGEDGWGIWANHLGNNDTDLYISTIDAGGSSDKIVVDHSGDTTINGGLTTTSYLNQLGAKKSYYRKNTISASPEIVAVIDTSGWTDYKGVVMKIELASENYAEAHAGLLTGYFFFSYISSSTQVAWESHGSGVDSFSVRDMGDGTYQIWVSATSQHDVEIWVDYSENPSGSVSFSSFGNAGTGGSEVSQTIGYTFNNDLTVNGTLESNSSSTYLGPENDNINVWLQGDAGKAASIYFNSGAGGFNSNIRWRIMKDNIAETGSNAGSRFSISAYDDSGNWIDFPILINRPAGTNIEIQRPIDMKDNVIDNIGNAGTGFDALGGLTLAGDLTVNSSATISGEVDALYGEIGEENRGSTTTFRVGKNPHDEDSAWYGIVSKVYRKNDTTETGWKPTVANYNVSEYLSSSTENYTGDGLIATNNLAANASDYDVSKLTSVLANISSTGTGTTTDAKAVKALITNTSGTIDKAYYFYVDAASASGGINEEYGLYMEDITKGTTKYAIYTNEGEVRLGDDTTIIGNLTANSSATILGNLEVDRIVDFPNSEWLHLLSNGRERRYTDYKHASSSGWYKIVEINASDAEDWNHAHTYIRIRQRLGAAGRAGFLDAWFSLGYDGSSTAYTPIWGTKRNLGSDSSLDVKLVDMGNDEYEIWAYIQSNTHIMVNCEYYSSDYDNIDFDFSSFGDTASGGSDLSANLDYHFDGDVFAEKGINVGTETGAGVGEVKADKVIADEFYGSTSEDVSLLSITKNDPAATTPVAYISQTNGGGGQPALTLDQDDESEGFIDFLGSDRGPIPPLTGSVASVRVELNGTVYRLALYSDA